MRCVGGIRFAALLLALLAAGTQLQAASEESTYTLINASASRVDFADQKAHLAQNGFVTFSILTVLASGNVGWSLSDVSINCSRSKISILSNANYAPGGAPLPTEAVDSAIQPISPATLGLALQAVVCNGVDPYPRSKPIVGVKAAVTKAHELIAALKPAAK